MNIKNIFLALVSFIFLAPTLFFFCGTNEDKNGNLENQETLVFKPKKPFDYFDSYYKNNFAFRNLLSKQYMALKSGVADVSSIPDKVIIGKDGWYYLGNSYKNVYSESLGVVKYPEKEIVTITNDILEMNRFCTSLGIKFYFFVAPNSHTIYKEFLPVTPNSKLRRIDILKINLKNKFDIIDVRSQLLAAKSENQLYHKTDTHWNEYGGYIGAQELLKNIKKDFVTVSLLDKNNFNIKKVQMNQMDLTKMLGIKAHDEKIFHLEKKLSPIQIRNDTINKVVEIHATNSSKKFRGIVYSDSFGANLIPFLNISFGNLTYLLTSKFSKERILAEKPDFVIFEVVERDLTRVEVK